ncbi:MAG: mechanosensitive ion channel family protein [Candidatus Paceibacterota bacterium]|jgi:small conductance mechanosensitive channel|nr:mechanosensitive ion channel family protein [Candidatus Paceibacterota bacterium]MDD4830581.1 mechanosensitive ion channel family protein [Candidatus Paceibacterota bacterium]MDD4874956.1 mechanosensitive ion channel family protein [Candidatus Paceibacterota bacterium]
MNEIVQKAINLSVPWLTTHGVKILVILIVAYFIQRSGKVFIEKIIRKLIVPDSFLSADAERKREDTLIRIFSVTMQIMIWVVVGLIVLQECGFAIGPFLAAAGVAGLALGFGGQYLIKDVISGFFIIMENQYRINDVVEINGSSGLVEDISLRMTTLRDLDGTVYHIPHGEITKVANMAKDFSRVNLDIGVSYNSNLEHVIEVINKTGKELAEDSQWKGKITKAPHFLRVDDFGDSAIVVKILGETAPASQWEVAGELRKRIKIVFDKEGIEIPLPQRVIHKAET